MKGCRPINKKLIMKEMPFPNNYYPKNAECWGIFHKERVLKTCRQREGLDLWARGPENKFHIVFLSFCTDKTFRNCVCNSGSLLLSDPQFMLFLLCLCFLHTSKKAGKRTPGFLLQSLPTGGSWWMFKGNFYGWKSPSPAVPPGRSEKTQLSTNLWRG